MNKACVIHILISFFLYSCYNTESNKYIEEVHNFSQYFGQEIEFPDSLYIYDNYIIKFESVQDIIKNDIKIVKVIDASCYACISDLNDTEDFFNEILQKFDKVSILLIISHFNDFEYFIEFLLPHFTINYPIILDINSSLLSINEFLPYDKNLRTYLLNNNNKITIIGNPNISNKLKKLYLTEIKNLLEK